MTNITDIEASNFWRIIRPGVLGTPNTSVTIEYVAQSNFPYRVLWQGKCSNVRPHESLAGAKRGAEKLIAELTEMGLEP
jgi:hypothetical protein